MFLVSGFIIIRQTYFFENKNLKSSEKFYSSFLNRDSDSFKKLNVATFNQNPNTFKVATIY